MLYCQVKSCLKAGEYQPRDAFRNRKRSKTGRDDKCKVCRRAYEKFLYDAHPNKRKGIIKKYLKTKKGKATYLKAAKKYQKTEKGKISIAKQYKRQKRLRKEKRETLSSTI